MTEIRRSRRGRPRRSSIRVVLWGVWSCTRAPSLIGWVSGPASISYGPQERPTAGPAPGGGECLPGTGLPRFPCCPTRGPAENSVRGMPPRSPPLPADRKSPVRRRLESTKKGRRSTPFSAVAWPGRGQRYSSSSSSSSMPNLYWNARVMTSTSYSWGRAPKVSTLEMVSGPTPSMAQSFWSKVS